MKWWKTCPLLLLLAVSGLILTGIAFANRQGVYRAYEQDSLQRPILSVLFLGAKDGVYPWTAQQEAAQMVMAQPAENREQRDGEQVFPQTVETLKEQTPSRSAEAGTGQEATVQPEVSERMQEETGAAAQNPLEKEGVSQGDGISQEESVPEQDLEEDIKYDFSQVDLSYMDDALFIGDSRTKGLMTYSQISEHATFYCQTSLTIFDLFKRSKAFIREDGEKKTLEQALGEHRFGKIYLMLGINEMGTGTPEYFFEEYASAVMKIRQMQPDAIIFVQSIMHVAEQKNASDPIFNNFNIEVRNVELQTLADDRNIFYLNVNEAVCDENGNLFEGWTYDQIHLKAKHYPLWEEYLLQHGIVKEERPEPAQNGAGPFWREERGKKKTEKGLDVISPL